MAKGSIIHYFEVNYRQLLKLATMMTKDAAVAQDVLHTVALVLLKKQDELDDVENFGAYIAQCIRRATLNYYRQNSRVILEDPERLEEFLSGPSSNPSYDYIEWVVTVESCLESFSKELRQAFIAHYIDGYPIEQLAKQLGISANALSSRFMRMRKALAKKMPETLRHIAVLSLL